MGAWLLAAVVAACGAQEVDETSAAAGETSESVPAAEEPKEEPSEAAYLERRVELAKSDSFYLLLDQEASELRLMFGGALLQTYPVQSLELGYPRAFFASVGDAVKWQATTWTAGVVTPAHPQVDLAPITNDQEVDEAEDPSAIVPPTAEEAIPVPPRYRIRFDGGLALEVRTAGEEGGSWALRWQDLRSALSASDRDAVRVLITLDADAAGALYRALPPDTKLLVSYRPVAGSR